jgi:superfamily II DNA or RNA helicase
MKTYITIENNHVCYLETSDKIFSYVYERLKIKHPNSFYMKMYSGSKYWDGYVKYLKKDGVFAIGLLEMVTRILDEENYKYEIIDQRKDIINIVPQVPQKLGELTLRPEQRKAIKTLVSHKVGGIPFNICVGDYNVGFGKTIVFAGIFKAYKAKLKTVLLLNDTDLFNQFKSEIPKLLPKEKIAFIQGGNVIEWADFNVCMVQSLARNIKTYQEQLLSVDMVLIDECDVIDNRTYSAVIKSLSCAPIRIGLSGTIYMQKSQKDTIHNLNIMSYIGSKVDRVSLKEQTKKGYLTPLKVTMVECDYPTEEYPDYDTELREVTIKNNNFYRCSVKRSRYFIKKKQLPMIIVVHYIEQSKKMYEYYKRAFPKLQIKYVNHETQNRKEIFEKFRKGKIDILISTLIISRGKNLPLAKYLQNSASMDSQTRALQILGRLVRKHESKNVGYLDDMVHPGLYLQRHAKHRKLRYSKEGYSVECKKLLLN